MGSWWDAGSLPQGIALVKVVAEYNKTEESNSATERSKNKKIAGQKEYIGIIRKEIEKGVNFKTKENYTRPFQDQNCLSPPSRSKSTLMRNIFR